VRIRSAVLWRPWWRCTVLPIGHTVLRRARRRAVLCVVGAVRLRPLVRRVRGALLLRVWRTVNGRTLLRCRRMRRVRMRRVRMRRIRCGLWRRVSRRVLRRQHAVPSERRCSRRGPRSGLWRRWRRRLAGRNDRGTVARHGGARRSFGLGGRGRRLDGEFLRWRVSGRRLYGDAGDGRFILRTPTVVIGQ